MKTFGWFTKINFPLKSLGYGVTFLVPPIMLFAYQSSAKFFGLICEFLMLKKRRRKSLCYWTNFIFIRLLAVLPPSVGVADAFNFKQPTITTSFGVVHGETIIPASGEDLPAVSQFLGIPYGVTPSKQYRFNMAISAPKWTHQPKNTFKFSPVCVQSGLPQLLETEALKTMSSQRFDSIHKIFPYLKPQSEDCLYMNIYVPEKKSFEQRLNNGNSSSQLSVLVIVHGGDYGWGAGNALNASILAAYGQTVVVTLNYRLGIYGFLGRCESNSCTGNAGLSDLVAALKMLSNILPSFGADPSSLTLLGWGSGAALISLLMASPITQPKHRLFRRAVLLDGSALCPWAMVDNPQQFLLQVAQELECKKQSNDRSEDIFQNQISHVIRCLQEHSHQNLTAAARKIQVPTFTSVFAPIIDGQIVPNHPKYSFSPKYGALFRNIDLMIGTVTYPAHHFLSNADLENGIDLTRQDKIVRTLVRNLFQFHRSEIFEAILNEYTDWDNPKNHPKTVRNNVLAALSDVLYGAPLVRTARMHATDESPKTSNTFFFVFAHETRPTAWTPDQSGIESLTHSNHGIRGSLSDEQLPYIFGFPLSNYQPGAQDFGRFTNDDKGISRVLMQYISNFVKSGDPAKPQPISTMTAVEERFFGTPWPQYSSATREAYLEISNRPRVKNYYRNAFVAFWNSFVPQLNRDNQQSNVPEEHNFLPDHFNKHSFYGYVRPYSSFHNDLFPLPPLPPTPFPQNALKRSSSSTTVGAKLAESFPSNVDQTKIAQTDIKSAENYNLAVTVAVGVGLLMLNLCIYALIIRKCTDKKCRTKKHLKYQSYTIGQPSTYEINYAANSLLGQPSSSAPFETQVNKNDHFVHTFSNNLQAQKMYQTNADVTINKPVPLSDNYQGNRSKLQRQLQSSISDLGISSSLSSSGQRKSSLKKHQEPLFTPNSNTMVSVPPGNTTNIGNSSFLPPGISPACPRHGRAAQLLIAAAAAARSENSIGDTNMLRMPSAGKNSINVYSGQENGGVAHTGIAPTTTFEEAEV